MDFAQAVYYQGVIILIRLSPKIVRGFLAKLPNSLINRTLIIIKYIAIFILNILL